MHVYRGDPDGRTPEPGTHITRTYVCVRCGRHRRYVQDWPQRATAPLQSAGIYHMRVV
ncbi:hypothetical protein [Cellulomonas sp. HZM]|uniref:hypothetical protein n=1 Tax=Cellulomonas sp. HZM TaxID=1454010 RepID=UPI0012DFBF12|nr:hypothetical protein [Cellulomonas sp. HZM]